MALLQILVPVFVLTVAYLSCVNAECSTLSKAKILGCVTIYSTKNLLNLDGRKKLIDAGNTTCPKDIIMPECDRFKDLQDCVNTKGFPLGCEQNYNDNLKSQKFECTYLELGAICPKAPKISSATSVAASITLLFVSVAATIFNRL